MPRLLFEKTDHGNKSSSSSRRRHGTPIHKRVNTILSFILGGSNKLGSCGSGYGSAMAHQRSLLGKPRTQSNVGRKGSGAPRSDSLAGDDDGSSSSSSKKKKKKMKKKEEEKEVVFELCKKKILLGERCRTLNSSGTLQYDANGVLIVEDFIN
ncbi:hypothetical protein Dimus_021676 [Dionaea muscipula]